MVTQVKSSNIAVGAITSDQIASGAITVADIPDGEITAAKLHTTLDLSGKTITYGNLPAANLTGSLPAIDGSSLTGIDALPSQTGSNGYFLTTDGSTASWAEVDAGAKNDMFWENSTTLSQSYTITSGKNAMSAGPINIGTGVTVDIPSGSVWTIV